ncbi:hypothetical protein [Actinoplanes palleronii]|uniref:Uncharacterized protein n=1 Tax=Actinoplanes palleronii TaxID=113570 RepID=A0ABQ4BKF4_9ACTN|nr:hypothetical protein [Actinoplanes palleronii]GIE70781.1 hypothetical protein Apa02nite_068890 [Actinoplanes palleronii]
MTSMIYGAYGRPIALDLNDTVTFNISPVAEATQRLVPPPRRPDAVGETRLRIPRTIGIVDEPLVTDSLPPFAAYAARQRPVALRQVPGRHRSAVQPGLLVRLLATVGINITRAGA